MASTAPLFIFSYEAFPMMERKMFGNSIQGGAAEPSFLYLMMAATYFRQASRTRHLHVRRALRDIGREYLTNADRVVPAHACSRSASVDRVDRVDNVRSRAIGSKAA
jgi:hypothetical protein